MSEIDEGTVMAWADGELDEVAARRLERAAADDPALAARLDAQKRLRDRLSAYYAPIAREPVPDALVALLTEAAKVEPLVQPRRGGARWMVGGALAASLVLGLAIGRMSGGGEGPVALDGGAMIARGDLAGALDTQLASVQVNGAQGDGPFRIGISFRRKGGGWCRSFDGAAMAGVACRDGGSWQLQQVVPGSARAETYRQAASGDARVMATVEALMDGAPVDADQEAAARAAGWR